MKTSPYLFLSCPFTYSCNKSGYTQRSTHPGLLFSESAAQACWVVELQLGPVSLFVASRSSQMAQCKGLLVADWLLCTAQQHHLQEPGLRVALTHTRDFKAGERRWTGYCSRQAWIHHVCLESATVCRRSVAEQQWLHQAKH